jgi:hypothetical protein
MGGACHGWLKVDVVGFIPLFCTTSSNCNQIASLPARFGFFTLAIIPLVEFAVNSLELVMVTLYLRLE